MSVGVGADVVESRHEARSHVSFRATTAQRPHHFPVERGRMFDVAAFCRIFSEPAP